jgi:hypothetical protein
MLYKGMLKFEGESTEVIKKYLDSAHPINLLNEAQIFSCAGMDHSGSGEAQIVWAKIKNSKNLLSFDFEMDENIQIEFGVNNPLELKLNYAVEILDQNDYPLFHFESEYEPRREFDSSNSKINPVVRIVIPPLFLFPDNYYVNLWAGLHHSRVDKVEKCFNIRFLRQAAINRELLITRGRIFKQGDWQITYNGSLKDN